MTSDPAFLAWKDRAASLPIADAAARLGIELRRVTRIEYAGPCPRCGGDDRFAINTRKNVFLCRPCDKGGHGAIDLAMFARDVGFLQAVELLTGEPPPDRNTVVTDADRARWAKEAAERAEKAAKREAEEEFRRRQARVRAYQIWKRAIPIDGTPAAMYLTLRGLKAPAGLRARCILDMPYYSGEGDYGEVLAHAPALALPMVDAEGKFQGLHLTYIDLTKPKGKLALPAVKDKPLAAKKMRGTSRGTRVEITRPAAPTRVIIGEGFEKTLAVWMALDACGRDLSETAFWSASSLGNMSRLAIPDSVTEVTLLGDSTSNRASTTKVIRAAREAYAKDGRVVKVAWAPTGMDFDDMLREAA